MLELLNNILNISFDQMIFLLFAIGLILFSCFAIYIKNIKSSVISFFCAILNLSGLLMLMTNMAVSLIILLIYSSLSLIFLISSLYIGEDNSLNHGRKIFFASIIFLTIFLVFSQKFQIFHTLGKRAENYSGISGVSLVLALVLITISCGITFLHSNSSEDDALID